MATVCELSKFVPVQSLPYDEPDGLNRGEKGRGRGTFEDDTKGAFADFFADTVVHANEVCGRR